jgi:hypothetical protein
MDQFKRLVGRLFLYADTSVFSFVDIYDKIKSNLAAAEYMSITSVQKENFARCFSVIASYRQIKLKTCAEDIELDQFGIDHSCCIDSDLIERITGYKLSVKKENTQKSQCHCVENVDVGQYNTCKHMCKCYYANYIIASVKNSYARHDPKSPCLLEILRQMIR